MYLYIYMYVYIYIYIYIYMYIYINSYVYIYTHTYTHTYICTHTDAKRAYREMHILRHLKHPNIIKLLDVLSPTIQRKMLGMQVYIYMLYIYMLYVRYYMSMFIYIYIYVYTYIYRVIYTYKIHIQGKNELDIATIWSALLAPSPVIIPLSYLYYTLIVPLLHPYYYVCRVRMN
jgi:serine/threonine protein kinase